MAGNVKEWCWNATEERRYILGGSWGEPTYTFKLDADSRPPFSREPSHGFRCARFSAAPDEALLAPATLSLFSSGSEPVADEVFEAYRRMYGYDPTDLGSTVDATDESSPHWRKETVSFQAAYGGERVIAHLFLPRNAEPPYQPVVWFPGNDAFFLPAGEALASPYLFDFIPRSGRALVYPVYKGMYERHVPVLRSSRTSGGTWWLCGRRTSAGRSTTWRSGRTWTPAEARLLRLQRGGFQYGPIFDRRRSSASGPACFWPGAWSGRSRPRWTAVSFAPRSRVPTLMINGQGRLHLPATSRQQEPLYRSPRRPRGAEAARPARGRAHPPRPHGDHPRRSWAGSTSTSGRSGRRTRRTDGGCHPQ